jgi:hypothetical protein
LSTLRQSLIYGGVAGTGLVVGFILGVVSRNPIGETWAISVESRYAHDMFCFAPVARAEPVLYQYREQLEARREEELLWKREYAVVLASVASLAEKAGRTNVWQSALAACRDAGGKKCDEERLKQEVAALCPATPRP